MNKYKMFFTLLFSMMLVLVALTSATTETYAQGNATYNVTRWRADGHHIRIELANRGTGLGVFLKKSGRDGKGYRFTNRGRYWIEARTPDGRRRYTWGPYTYDSRVQNYQYSHTIRPENVLPHGEIWYRIKLISDNDQKPKYTGYAKARTNCPYNWRYGLYMCN